MQVPKDKIREVEHIIEALGEWQGTDPQTGFQLVKTADGTILKIADLVDDDPTKRDKVANALKDPAYKNDRDRVDIIIALGMAKEGCQNNLVQSWLPALGGMVEKLEQGARVADVGCGHGISTTIMAQAFPNISFEVSLAKELPGHYDLVTIFDCLHDMGDPVGAMKHVRELLDENGACMIVEPMAGDRLADNFNPVSRLYYSASTMVCIPTSLAQEQGAALGSQAGEKRLREAIVDGAGFNQLNRIAETPFSLVLEARP
jgi:Methyltransferase domain